MKRISHRSAVLLISLISIIGIVSFILLFMQQQEQLAKPDPVQVSTLDDWTIEESVLNGLPLNENKAIYRSDSDGSLDTLFITVFPTDTPDGRIDFTAFDYHQALVQDYNPTLDANITYANPDGELPMLADKDRVNARIRVRGASERGAAYKSYRIELTDDRDALRGLKVINLNKHVFDPGKITNKFSMDLFRQMENMASLRTNFVHVFIRDKSLPPEQQGYVDYGLFTQVEQPNQTYLESHGLDPNGTLYKAEYFEFRQEDALRSKDDPDYDPKAFEQILSIREADDHEKLLDMLSEINNINQDFEPVFQRYFNEDNYLTWMAANILLGNYDTVNRNFMLYSPTNSETFYFLPWDYDKAMNIMGSKNFPRKWLGLQRYTGVLLHRRYFRTPESVDKLTRRMEELLDSVMSPESVHQLVQTYRPVVSPFLTMPPDLGLLRMPPNEMTGYWDQFDDEILNNYDIYKQNLELPLPVFTGDPIRSGRIVRFTWESSYDLQQEKLSYQLQLARDPQMQQIIFSTSDLIDTLYEYQGDLPDGTYYLALQIFDSSGHDQISLDYFIDPDTNLYYYGVRQVKLGGS
ncbi:MAG: hypothetical protein EOM70_05455 [Clostridia bacterium]|nr:hypothetical protein [Clostridia bacterium]